MLVLHEEHNLRKPTWDTTDLYVAKNSQETVVTMPCVIAQQFDMAPSLRFSRSNILLDPAPLG